MLYLLAAWTGFRKNELASLTLRSFDFAADPAVVTVDAAYSKRRRRDEIPLHPGIVDILKAWLVNTDVKPNEPVFPLRTSAGKPRKTCKRPLPVAPAW